MPDEKKPQLTDRHVEMARITEGHQTTRYIVTGIVIVALALIIAVTYVSVTKPAWLAFALALIMPTGLLGYVIKFYLSSSKKSRRRIERLEEFIASDQSTTVTRQHETEISENDSHPFT